MGPLHVIAVISNPCRFKSRYKLYHEFAKRVQDAPGAILHTVELAYGHRPFEVTEAGGHNQYQYRTHEELWHKENMINLGISRLPHDWEYVAWVDADIMFARPDWALETVQQLQHYKFVQMWSHATDLGPRFEPIVHHTGFIYDWRCGRNIGKRYGYTFHPGFAWAARRDAMDEVGKLIDYALLGSGDFHLAGALVGQISMTFQPGMSGDYKDALKHYERLCEKHIRRKVGYVDTHLTHFYHGKKRERQYETRWKILTENNYSPYKDIIYDTTGLIRLTSEKNGLRDGMMRYFRSRNEDSIDL